MPTSNIEGKLDLFTGTWKWIDESLKLTKLDGFSGKPIKELYKIASSNINEWIRKYERKDH